MRQYVLRNEKDARYCAGQIIGLSLERPIEVTLKLWRPKRSSGQNKLLWKRHTAVAAAINVSSGKIVTPEWVHYEIFSKAFLPGKLITLPDGSEHWAPDETSSNINTKKFNDALTAYEAWCVEWDIELDDSD